MFKKTSSQKKTRGKVPRVLNLQVVLDLEVEAELDS